MVQDHRQCAGRDQEASSRMMNVQLCTARARPRLALPRVTWLARCWFCVANSARRPLERLLAAVQQGQVAAPASAPDLPS